MDAQAQLRGTMLELTDLEKRYGDVRALDGCTIRAQPGRMLGLLGPNGSGKTTAMRSVFGLVHLDRGAVHWRGAPIRPEERARFGYMPEQRGLYPRMRVRDQAIYFARLHGLSTSDAATAADHWLERLGLADRATARVEELSHGNQQRVQLIVALAHQADLLILDEPFSGLDPIGVAALGDVVREQAERGAAVVFSSHQLDLVEDLCDDIAIIHRGRVVLAGELDAVRAASPSRYVHASVVTDGAAATWHAGIEGAETMWERGPESRLRVPNDANPALLLWAAQAAGEVRFFRFEPPALSDLFMEAIGAAPAVEVPA
ncbi:MAG: ATP-binding cassette domain-containing protein [Chloroflexi bacterium]|nr:ATP-binding cassette domain-containing protein [Chloroflexota bacterium]MDA1145292.1 ATP-binding cassette domain-containing protein [Chloroflexota bacterium]